MLVKMSDEKKYDAEPSVVIAASQVSDGARKTRLTKKSILIAVIALLITGLAVTAVLVGIRLVTDSNLEVIKYTLNANGVTQNVSTDNNVVSYHVVKGDVEAWIVQDFDKDIQVTKILSGGQTTCYVTALNRSLATDASSIPSTTPDVNNMSPSESVVYQVASQSIKDISYLGKKASSMCQNIPTYHAVPDCGKNVDKSGISTQNTTAADHRSKRTPAFCARCTTSSTCLCACGCCAIVCGEFSSYNYVAYWNGRSWSCTYWMRAVYGYGSLSGSACRFNNILYNP